jgi:hypothetical protein
MELYLYIGLHDVVFLFNAKPHKPIQYSGQIYRNYGNRRLAKPHFLYSSAFKLPRIETQKLLILFHILYKGSNLYSSPSIIRVIKSRRMRWAGHAARMGERRNAGKFSSSCTIGGFSRRAQLHE